MTVLKKLKETLHNYTTRRAEKRRERQLQELWDHIEILSIHNKYRVIRMSFGCNYIWFQPYNSKNQVGLKRYEMDLIRKEIKKQLSHTIWKDRVHLELEEAKEIPSPETAVPTDTIYYIEARLV